MTQNAKNHDVKVGRMISTVDIGLPMIKFLFVLVTVKNARKKTA